MGRTDYALTPEQKMDARAALALLAGSEISLEEAARRAIVGRRAGKRVLFPAAVDQFTLSRIKEGCRSATVDWYTAKISLFGTLWEHRAIDGITRAEIREAIEMQPVSESTKAAYGRALRALWRFCAALEPPITGADVTHGLRTTAPRVAAKKSKRDKFLSLTECEKILFGIKYHRPALALQLFAGIRPEEIHGLHKPPLLWKHVNTADHLIRVPREVAKTDKPRLIQGLPPAVWAWLGRPGDPEAPVCPVQAIEIRRAARRILGYPLPYDAFRHTFITNAVALLGEAGSVSMWIGHEGRTSLIFNTYMGLLPKADAVKFWALRPQ